MATPSEVNFRDENWTRRMAELEDRCESITVGGLAVDSGFSRSSTESENVSIARKALAKLIVFTRRDLGLAAEQFAQRASIEYADLVRLERGGPFVVDQSIVTQLASALGVPASSLMSLCCLSGPPRSELQRAALRFTTNPEHLQQLSEAESAALRDFMRALSAQPPRS